jgi:hypothetical protein
MRKLCDVVQSVRSSILRKSRLALHSIKKTWLDWSSYVPWNNPEMLNRNWQGLSISLENFFSSMLTSSKISDPLPRVEAIQFPLHFFYFLLWLQSIKCMKTYTHMWKAFRMMIFGEFIFNQTLRKYAYILLENVSVYIRKL